MSRLRILCSCLLLIVSVTDDCLAQAGTADTATVGERVRVTAWMPRREEGLLIALTPDSLAYSRPEGTRILARADVRLLEVARGSETRERSGAIGGVLAGAVVGTLLGGDAVRRQNSRQHDFPQLSSESSGAFAGALLGTLVGGLIGNLIGRHLTTTRWEVATVGGVRASR